MLRKAVKEAPEELWSASLYAGWLYTLNPLLEEKGAGYPSFMTTDQWRTKALETYAGSFTELKHDTVLYAKQVMAEMGGGAPEELDDRGYVEPEAEVYRRFAELAEQTADGLQVYGILDPADRENLTRLASLARSLEMISRKELQNERLSDEEYDLIREYGGTLEHFWIEAVKDRTDAEYLGRTGNPGVPGDGSCHRPERNGFAGRERPSGADLCDRAGGRNASHRLRRRL